MSDHQEHAPSTLPRSVRGRDIRRPDLPEPSLQARGGHLHQARPC